jgi:hypothetical protein
MSTRTAAAALLLVGTLQMSGDLMGITALKAIGMATAASPAPRVFSAMRGLEPYSTRFHLEWRTGDGGVHSLALTPDVYQRLAGPYNRRNAYGAVLAAGPVLATDDRTSALFASVASHALCGASPLLRELGVDSAARVGPPWIRYEPVAGSRMDAALPTVIVAPCP